MADLKKIYDDLMIINLYFVCIRVFNQKIEVQIDFAYFETL